MQRNKIIMPGSKKNTMFSLVQNVELQQKENSVMVVMDPVAKLVEETLMDKIFAVIAGEEGDENIYKGVMCVKHYGDEKEGDKEISKKS